MTASDLHRYELVAPTVPSTGLGISDAVGTLHVGRASLLIRIGGGHLAAPLETLRAQLLDEGARRLASPMEDAAATIDRIVAWLEGEHRGGILDRCYTTASLVVVAGDEQIHAWHVGPHGALRGTPDGVTFVTVDFRMPELRRLGVVAERTFPTTALAALDRASSIFCVGTPHGYGTTHTALAPGEVFVAFERGSLPFGPLPTVSPVPLASIWEMDAPWRHGLSGRAVAIGRVAAEELSLPAGWRATEIALPRATIPTLLRH